MDVDPNEVTVEDFSEQQQHTSTTPQQTPTTPQPPPLNLIRTSASSPRHLPLSPTRSAPSMTSSAAISSSLLGSPHYNPSPFFPPPLLNMMSPGCVPQPATLDSLSQQILSLSQCVMTLSQRVSDNQRLFEENLRLKDIVIDLELKLKEANERVKSIDVLREAMTSEFAELNRNLQTSRMMVGGDTCYMEDDEGYEPVLNVSRVSEPCMSQSVSPERGERVTSVTPFSASKERNKSLYKKYGYVSINIADC